MNIAIVGSGLAGLSAAFHLIQKGHTLTIYFDKPGASHAAAGLMHRFPGDRGLKAYMADEAYAASLKMMQTVSNGVFNFYKQIGFDRIAITPSMLEGFLKADPHQVKRVSENQFFIEEGTCVEVPLYLDALRDFLQKKGAIFIHKKITSLDALEKFDRVIIAAGFGIKEFNQPIKLKYLKGQSFVYPNLQQHQRPLLAKGYLVPFEDKVVIGSTYERNFNSSDPDPEAAHALLDESLKMYYTPYDTLEPEAVLSGVRVAHPNRNLPQFLIEDKRLVYITGLGSRGLLYHGWVGELACQYIEDWMQMSPPWACFVGSTL